MLPIVLYHGETRWTAAVELTERMEPAPAELQPYQPRQRYLLLDEGAYSDTQLAGLRNWVATVFRLENSRTPENVLAVVTTLLDWLQHPEQTRLRRAFTVWIQRVILADRAPEAVTESLIELDEVRTMLAQRVQEWKQQWRDNGFAEGMVQGERVMLIRQSRLRFGALSAETLAPLLDRVEERGRHETEIYAL